jgi:hypothetical protein
MSRPGGLFVLRDHDCTSPEAVRLVSVVHTLFNCGLDAPWSEDAGEPRFFLPLAETIARVEAHGVRDVGARLRQANDPTDNVLVAFRKEPV